MSLYYGNFADRKRQPDKPTARMSLTGRDIRMLEDIYLFGGVLSTHHIQTLHFDGKQERARQQRLSRLFHNGFLNRTSKAGMAFCQTMVYWLTAQGARMIAQSLNQPDVMTRYVKFPKFAEILHDLKIVDVRLAVNQACEQQRDEFEVEEWTTERDLRAKATKTEFVSLSGEVRHHKVVPDAFVVIRRRAERAGEKGTFYSRLLLEIDLSNHPNKRFAEDKVLPGIAWIRSKDYEQRYGKASGRWLVVTKSDQRLGFLIDTTAKVAGKDAILWYFTTFDRLTSDSVLTNPIWFRASNHHEPVALFPPVK